MALFLRLVDLSVVRGLAPQIRSYKTLYMWCRYLYEMSETIWVASNDGFKFGTKLVRLDLVQHVLVSLETSPKVS
jgi:hypothetical protein